MKWQKLMSNQRVGIQRGDERQRTLLSARSEYERDWDRIVFSQAFRRLHDKTQVFPLPAANDVVHSRLTHSLEVASVGRMLGTLVGNEVRQREPNSEFSPQDVGAVVAAAALAHDIGNAPLGHAGEVSIRGFFQRLAKASRDDDHASTRFQQLAPAEQMDLQSFDGNPQGFRVLARLQQEPSGGMQLTAATLGALAKYPWPSTDPRTRKGKRAKFGFYQADLKIFEAVANETGLAAAKNGWVRHPLALLVEAADDICYSILDIEDGVRLGIVTRDAAIGLLNQAEANDGSQGDVQQPIEQFRAHAIEQLVERSKDRFVQNYDAIMDGIFETALTDGLPGIKELKKLAFNCCYSSPEVLELEVAGDEAIRGLLETFTEAVLAQDPDTTTYRLLKAKGVLLEPASNDYERLLRVVDYVSGMTDGYAFDMYRRLAGIDLPSRVG